MFFDNEEVREEFAMEKHYVGPMCNRPVPSFCVGVDCHKDYMVLVRAGDEEHLKPIWLVKTLFSPNLSELASIFIKLK